MRTKTRLDAMKELIEPFIKMTSRGINSEIRKDSRWRVLGNGHFSTVFEHTDYPEYALKVCHTTGDSWPFYAKYCKDNKDNQEVNFLLPNIHAFHLIQSRGLYIALLDKLEPVRPGHGLIKEHYLHNPESAVDQLYAVFKVFTDSIAHWTLDDLTPKDPCLKYQKASKLIMESLQDFCSIDVHADNVMQDSSGNIIVTDPVSFHYGDDSKLRDVEYSVRDVEYSVRGHVIPNTVPL